MSRTMDAQSFGISITSPEKALFRKLTSEKIDDDGFLKEAAKFVTQYIVNNPEKHDLIFSVDPRLYLSGSDGENVFDYLTTEEKKALSRNLVYLNRVADSFKHDPNVLNDVKKTLGVPHPIDRIFLALSKNPGSISKHPNSISLFLKMCDSTSAELQLPNANFSLALKELKDLKFEHSE